MRKRIRTSLVFVFLFCVVSALLSTSYAPPNMVTRARPRIDYALIVDGDQLFCQDAYFVEWTLLNVFNVPRNQIRLLAACNNYTSYPEYFDLDGYATYDNVRTNISDWLANQGTNLFIYVTAHGGGMFTNGTIMGGRLEQNSDEGNEIFINNTWWGVDESINLYMFNGSLWSYWDDDFRQDISSINDNMRSLTIMLETCRSPEEPGLSCFSGGFIDDCSSVYRRTVITASNETGTSEVRGVEGVAEFVYYYMNAFSDFDIREDIVTCTYYKSTIPNNWTYQDWRGAFEYALMNDTNYLNQKEYPWFDDDGNGLPNLGNNSVETLDFPVSDLAGNHSNLMRWLRYDVNYDGKVDMKDVAIVARAFGTKPGDALWNRQADVFAHEDWKVDMADVGEVSHHYGSQT